MSSPIYPTILLFLALHALQGVSASTCGGDKPLALCCLGLAPWYTNSYVWGSICGYAPSNPNELIGGRCITIANGDTCPSGSISTCCTGVVPGQCGLGTDCGTPTIPTSSSSSSVSSTPTPVPAPIPSGWSVASACAQDNASRVIANSVVAYLTANNTPANCINHCISLGYTFAGVEYGDECYCGTGFLPGTPENTGLDPAQCNVRCTGDSQYTCGGSWAIQLYTGPRVIEQLPGTWAVLMACAEDTPSRVIAGDVTTLHSDNTPATCIEHCESLGYTYAGVEYGDECHCGRGFAGGLVSVVAPSLDCDIPCAGNEGMTCGGSWRIQIYNA